MRQEVLTSAIIKFAVSDQLVTHLDAHPRSPSQARPKTINVGDVREGILSNPRVSLTTYSVSPAKPINSSSRP